MNDFTVVENSVTIMSCPYYKNMVHLSMHVMVPFNVIYTSISHFLGLAEHFYFSNIFSIAKWIDDEKTTEE